MTAIEKLNVGVVGACGRGGRLVASLDHVGAARVHAVCDINADGLPAAKGRLDAAEAYTDYEEMLEKSDLGAVIVGTPMPLHVGEDGHWIDVPDSREW